MHPNRTQEKLLVPEVSPRGLTEVDISEELSTGIEISVLEDKKGKKKLLVKLITTGWSKNGYYYPPDVAESVADLITARPKMFMDHADWYSGAHGFNNLVGIATESYGKDGAAFAEVEIVENPATAWLYDLAVNFPDQVGASIDARAKVKELEEDKLDALHPERRFEVVEITFLNSVDFVTYAAAGGEVVNILAHQFMDKTTAELTPLMEKFETSFSARLTEAIRELKNTDNGDQPDKVEKTSNPTNNEVKMEIKTLTDLREAFPGLVADLVKEAVTSFKADEAKNGTVVTLTEQVETLTADINSLKESNAALQTKVDDYEVKEAVQAKRAKIDQLIESSALETTHVTKTFIKTLMKMETEEDMLEHIKDRETLIENSSGQVHGNGTREEESIETVTKEEFDNKALVTHIKSKK